MSAFEPGPEHRFAFGLRAPTEPWEFVYQLGDLGVWGIGFQDDDLVPVGASAAARHDILDKFSKALDSTGVVVSMTRTNLAGLPVFSHGAFTSADRDVRRFAIQKAMRAIDLGAELGAPLHDLPDGVERVDSVAAKPPRDALGRYREAVDFLCGYVREQGYPTRFAITAEAAERPGAMLLSTIGHALAFIDTLEHPEMVGLNPELAHGTVAGGGCYGVAQAIDAGKLLHVDLNAPPIELHEKEPCFGSASVSEAFFVVKLLAESGYDGPLHFDIDPHRLEDRTECGTSPSVACAPTARSPPRCDASLTILRSATPWRSAARSELAEPDRRSVLRRGGSGAVERVLRSGGDGAASLPPSASRSARDRPRPRAALS